MTEGITDTGLELDSYDTLLSDIQDNLNKIYASDGNSINFDSDTPDGQITNIYAQIAADLRQLYTEVYNSFDPSKCSGTVQDSRYQLNYITRNGGTFTIQNIDVTCTQTVELQGLDDNYNSTTAASGFTVSNNAGELWYLIDSVTLEAGTYSLPFRSANYGHYTPAIGTINNMVTKVLGVTTVNNSVSPTTYGEEQETDSNFRVRRERSTEKHGQNNIDVMLGQLLDLDGVTDGTTWVNKDPETDSTGTPAGYVWVIVEGGANTEIAEVIYTNAAGHGMRGNVSVDVPALSGQVFNVKFDRPTPIPLYIRFDFKLTVSQDATDTTAIIDDIVENLTYSLNEDAETSKITSVAADAILTNGGGGYALNVEISTDGETWTDYIASTSLANKFVVDSTRITVNIIEV